MTEKGGMTIEEALPYLKEHQQAITQQLVPIYEPLFAENSFGYRPNRSAKDAISEVKGYAEQGYTFAVVLDLSKYFDTLNQEILINLLRRKFITTVGEY